MSPSPQNRGEGWGEGSGAAPPLGLQTYRCMSPYVAESLVLFDLVGSSPDPAPPDICPPAAASELMPTAAASMPPLPRAADCSHALRADATLSIWQSFIVTALAVS